MIKKSYLIRKGMPLIFFWLFAGNVWAACWAVVISNEEMLVSVDKCSIEKEGAYKKVWVKWEYTVGKKINAYRDEEFIKIVSLDYHDCRNKKYGNIRSLFYSKSNEVLRDVSLALKNVILLDTVPDTFGETVMSFVCSSKNQGNGRKNTFDETFAELMADTPNDRKKCKDASDIFLDTPPLKKK